MTPLTLVLWATLAPPLAAAAGALAVYLGHRGQCEWLQDEAYRDGWRACRAKARATAPAAAADVATITSIRPPGARHAGAPADSPAVIAHLALADVAAEFDRIRTEFGLGPIEGPAGSETASAAYPADIPGPPSGGLLRAAGIVPEAIWPRTGGEV